MKHQDNPKNQMLCPDNNDNNNINFKIPGQVHWKLETKVATSMIVHQLYPFAICV